jgi:hypothetical protein
MKIYWIHNVVYFPLLSNRKYMKGTINGIILGSNQLTVEEIKAENPDVKEVEDLHDLCKAWGNKL